MNERLQDNGWRATATAGLAMLIALALVLAWRDTAAASVAVAAAGVVVAGFVLAPRAGAFVRRNPLVTVLLVAAVLAFGWFVLAGWSGAGRLPYLNRYWLGELGAGRMLELLAMVFAGIGGLILIADALRVRMGLGRKAPWRAMTGGGAPAQPPFPWRGVVGGLLVVWAAVLAVVVAGPFASGDALGQLAILAVVGVVVLLVIGTPLLIAGLARTDQDQVTAAREDERQRVAAHLHDSVLQTLALVQRSAHDPVAVARLARRQEHALRAWMAGESELFGETLGAALRDVVAEVEDAHDVAVEVSIIGDRPLDPVGEATVAAAREALRNAARHAAGAPTFVFAEIANDRVEVFVRDDGPGFVPDAVPSERRGLRDAVTGRMAAVGGGATVESAPGEGTEIVLRGGPRRSR